MAIDEKEYLRLGLLLEQTFPGAEIQMVSTFVNPAAVARPGAFGRSDEYLFFVFLGGAGPQRVRLPLEWVSGKGRTHTGRIRWDMLRRSGTNARRADRPTLFYPIYVDPEVPAIAKIGAPLPDGESSAPASEDLVAVLPIRNDGTEGNWTAQPSTLKKRLAEGRVRVRGSIEKGYSISVIKDGEWAKVQAGHYQITGRGPDGSVEVGEIDTSEGVMTIPSSQWRVSSHDSTQYGTRLLARFLPGRRFPFPKSLYAVEDAIRFFVSHKPDAVVCGLLRRLRYHGTRVGKAEQARRRSAPIRLGYE